MPKEIYSAISNIFRRSKLKNRWAKEILIYISLLKLTFYFYIYKKKSKNQLRLPISTSLD